MAFFSRIWTYFSGDTKQLHKQSDALKIGILGAANICNLALINPASKLPNVLVYGIAARDRQRAEAFARKHHIPKVYDDYDQLLADPDIDLIYNPLPNGLHYQWTIKALRAGKHVLCETPLSNNAEEAREMVDEARRQTRLLVEAFHYRYHPFCRDTLTRILSNKTELGAIQSVSASCAVPDFYLKANDIRLQYRLGGGVMMDMGCYPLSMARFAVETYNGNTDGSFEVQKAEAIRVSPDNPQIDRGMRIDLLLNGTKCQVYCEYTNNWSLPTQQLIVECERATITASFLVAASLYHYVTVRQKDTGQKRTEKNYAENRSTHYYQLKAFADAVRIAQQEPEGSSLDMAYEVAFTTGESGIRNMEIIDEIYRKAGLAVRGTKL